MAKDENNKTHVLMMDCIISEFGRCEAGYMLSEADVSADTWTWLQNQRFLKSVEAIEQEADFEPAATETTETPIVQVKDIEVEADSKPATPETPVVQKARTGKKTVPAVE